MSTRDRHSRFWWDPSYDDYVDSEHHAKTCRCQDCFERRWLAGEQNESPLRAVSTEDQLKQGELLLDDDHRRIGESQWENHWYGYERIVRVTGDVL